MKKKRKDITLSKKLAVTVLRVWEFAVVFSCIAICFGIDSSNILVSVSGSLGIVLSGYFAKSFLENKEKYGKEGKNDGYGENGPTI